ncbi:DUF4365 domain-containing protein [Nocardia vulneris]|uniref:DUF4365 domain-containing protein n=1 Tax=Nocardia vulneris TaxID=1141657 RepID=UPI0030CB9C86
MSRSAGLSAQRGDIAVTASMEKLQDAYLGAIAAAAGCELSKPDPDPSLDWTIGLRSKSHTAVRTPKIDVALKCTYQTDVAENGEFSFQLKNSHLEVLSEVLLLYPRLLVVMLTPREVDDWVFSTHHGMTVRNSMFWVNLKGVKPSGDKKTTVKVPYKQRFDAPELCRILRALGSGGSI